MKRLLITAMFCGLLTTVFAQTKTDSVAAKTDTSKTKKHGYKLLIGFKTKTTTDTVKPKVIKPASHFNFGLTFSRFDLGFARLIDNGSFTLSPKNQFLDYKGGKTAYVGFDVLQLGYRFNPYFKIYLAGGFDWTLIRLRQNITIQENTSTLTYTTDQVNYSKNRFSASYLRIPLAFDFRTKDDKRGNKFHFTVGPEIGFLLNGKVKQISDEMGKKKFYDNYHFKQFRYGYYARVGYKSTGLFVKYYANDVFENSPDQNGLKNLNFGLTFGL
ncbi:outer membrane beta-barrel protein [uncultured Mucilaginibacter sp.]|uniref:outer membrane beta-barrel protein n=1 Tax=uncultured Mucilaginibacter sp. TaxID=797541 RepID=UPI002617D7DD|nr:outer membrane beta-barrel protein [uncultured Mucilaginibacter sp.]